MATYKIKAGDTPLKIAAQFKIPVQTLLKTNPGVERYSTGMKIRLPSLSQPSIFSTATAALGFNPQAPSIFSNARAAAGNAITAFQNSGVGKFLNSSAPQFVGYGQAPQAQRGVPTSAYGQRYAASLPTATPGTSATSANAAAAAASLKTSPVETSAYGQLAAFRRSSALKYNTVTIDNGDGTMSTQPRTIGDGSSWTSGVAQLAVSSGMSRDQIRQELQAQGYVQYGNQWIYNQPAGAASGGEKDKKRAWYGFRGDKWRINKKTGQVYSVAKNNGRQSGRNSQSPPGESAPAVSNSPASARIVTWRV